MTVYVDNMRARRGRFIFSHMLADSDEELLAMADAIGVDRKWHQSPGTWRSHFDICQKMKRRAIELGALEVTQIQAAKIRRARRCTASDRKR